MQKYSRTELKSVLVMKNIVSALKNSIRIFKLDLAKIFSNWVSMVVIGGLIFLPSLYAWFNIYASWDPYGNTGNIKVAVVNEDLGGSIRDIQVNIGESVVESLMKNEALGWVFFETREEGLAEVEKGEVYATLIIPADFSKKIVTLVEDEPTKPQLEYYVNEKINAIAPKITDKGATAVQNQITTSFVETVADKVIDVMYSVGIELDATYPIVEKLENMMERLSDRIPKLDSKLDQLADVASNGKATISRQDEQVVKLQNILGQLVDFNEGISDGLQELSTRPEEMIPEIKENLVLVQTIFADVSNATLNLKESIELNKPVMISDIDSSISKLESTKSRLIELASKAAELDKDLGSHITSTSNELISILDDYVQTLDKLQHKLEDMDEATKLLTHLGSLNESIASKLQSVREKITSQVQKIDYQLATLEKIASKVENLFPTQRPNVPPTTDEDDILGETGGEEDNVEVDTALIEAVDDLLGTVNTVQQNMNGNATLYGDAIYELEDLKNNLTSMSTLAENGNSVESPLSTAKLTARSLSATIRSIRTLLEMRTTHLTDKLSNAEELFTEVNHIVKSMQNTISNVASGGQEKIDQMISNIDTIQDKLSDVADRVVNTMHSKADQVQVKVEDINISLTELQSRLDSLKGKIEDNTSLETTLQDISKLAYNIGASLDNTINLLDSDFIAKLKEQISQMDVFVNDVSSLLNGIQNELEYLRDFGQRLASQSEVAKADILEVKAHVPTLQEKVDKIKNKITELNENVDIRELIDKLTGDNRDKSDFLASPVQLETTILYPMANYGTGLTPFYTTLCLWVGALLLTALLTTTAHNADFKYTPIEEYFGKYFLFGLCAILQGFIASLGDIIVLGVRPQHSVLFVGLGVLYSMVFTAIVYTFVALLSNIGKAIGIVLLVVQLGGAGGTFPIQVTPRFFQRMYKFLPFTYGISGMREAIAGIYRPTLIKDIIIICLFGIGILIIGALLKEKANKFLHKYSEQLGDSGVIGH